MQTQLTEEMRQNARALEADSILRACVHCGFCTATCPTYQLLGDELDGPRGRIYLIKQVLEGNEVTLKTQEHLDRCLTCRNCETTCPSGVRYHNLLDIGRDIVEQKVKRPLPERMLREGLRQVVPRPAVFRALTQVGLVLRPFLPEQVRAKLPAETVKAKPRPPLRHKRRVLMLEGCAQPTLSPNTNAATARVLEKSVGWGSASCQLTKQAVVARWTIILMRRRKGWNGRAIILMPGGPRLKQVPRQFCKPPAVAARLSKSTGRC